VHPPKLWCLKENCELHYNNIGACFCDALTMVSVVLPDGQFVRHTLILNSNDLPKQWLGETMCTGFQA